MMKEVMKRKSQKCIVCNKQIKIGTKCIQNKYLFYHKKCALKSFGELKLKVKCPYKNKEHFENNYLNKLSFENIIGLFRSWIKRQDSWYERFIKSKIEELKNLSDSERKDKFENARIKEIIFDFIKYILIENYKDLGWNIKIQEVEDGN